MILKYRTDTPLWTMHQIGLSQLPKQTYKLTCHFYPNFGQSLGNSDNKDLLWRIYEILCAVMVKLH